MATASERMKTMRARRRQQGVREVRLVVADPRAPSVRERLAAQIAMLSQQDEQDALDWIEAVSIFDEPGAQSLYAAR